MVRGVPLVIDNTVYTVECNAPHMGKLCRNAAHRPPWAVQSRFVDVSNVAGGRIGTGERPPSILRAGCMTFMRYYSSLKEVCFILFCCFLIVKLYPKLRILSTRYAWSSLHILIQTVHTRSGPGFVLPIVVRQTRNVVKKGTLFCADEDLITITNMSMSGCPESGMLCDIWNGPRVAAGHRPPLLCAIMHVCRSIFASNLTHQPWRLLLRRRSAICW